MSQLITGLHWTPSQLEGSGEQVGQHCPGTLTGIEPLAHTGSGQSTASQLGPPPMLTEPATPTEPPVEVEPEVPTPPVLVVPALLLEPALLGLPAELEPPLAPLELPPSPGSPEPKTAPPQATAEIAPKDSKNALRIAIATSSASIKQERQF